MGNLLVKIKSKITITKKVEGTDVPTVPRKEKENGKESCRKN